jgi:hypothetical protein
LIPPLPPKKNLYDDKANLKRAKYLERFLNAVLRSEELKSYPFVHEFLRVAHTEQSSKWLPRRLKEEAEANIPRMKPLQSLSLIKGEARITPSENN